VRVVSWVIPSLYTRATHVIALRSGADFAVLQLAPVQRGSSSVDVGSLTGWLGREAMSNRSLKGATVTNVGYPAQTFSGVNQYRSRGPILLAQQLDGVGVLAFSNLSLPIQDGSSGSPLFRATAHGPVIVGLTEGSFVGTPINIATKITNRVNDFIESAEQQLSSGGQVLHFDFAARSHTPSFVPGDIVS
jgi:V8-like Glu-specific endopeptidase